MISPRNFEDDACDPECELERSGMGYYQDGNNMPLNMALNELPGPKKLKMHGCGEYRGPVIPYVHGGVIPWNAEQTTHEQRQNMKRNSRAAAQFWMGKEQARRKAAIKKQEEITMMYDHQRLKEEKLVRLNEEKEERARIKKMEKDFALQFVKEEEEAMRQRREQEQEILSQQEEEWAEKLEAEKREVGRLKAEKDRLEVEWRHRLKNGRKTLAEKAFQEQLKERQLRMDRRWERRLEAEKRREEMIKAQIERTKFEIKKLTDGAVEPETPSEVTRMRLHEEEEASKFQLEEDELAKARKEQEIKALARAEQEWEDKLAKEKAELKRLKTEHERLRLERHKRLRQEQHYMSEAEAANRLKEKQGVLQKQWTGRLEEELMKEDMIKSDIGRETTVLRSETQELERLRSRLKSEKRNIAHLKARDPRGKGTGRYVYGPQIVYD